MVDDHSVDVPPADHMLVVRNDDVPGMIAAVTGRLGEAGVNIDDMHLGRSAAGTAALMVLATDVAVAEEVQEAIRALPGVVSVRSEEHTSELQSLMRISYAVFCLKKKKQKNKLHTLSMIYNTLTN